MVTTIIKRDGSIQHFDAKKIEHAIIMAFKATDASYELQDIYNVAARVTEQMTQDEISVEAIQDLVETELMHGYPEVAKKFIIYREWRTNQRDQRTELKQTMDGIVSVEANDVNNENANMSSNTPSGQMMTFASEITKDYTHKYLLNPKYSRMHRSGDIHVHDLDYYPTKTTTCLQYNLEELFERGFKTKNGSIRTPQSIQSYATLATIIFQTNQNEQHGGQAIPAFDFFMAPGVLKTFRKFLIDDIIFIAELAGQTLSKNALKILCNNYIPSIVLSNEQTKALNDALSAHIILPDNYLHTILDKAYAKAENATYQAMEGFIHNLNTMHSRGGNQVVFSSINYGTDTSPEGRIVIRQLLRATIDGLGRGEIPVFPIQIFKVKEGISYSDADFEKAGADFQAATEGKIAFEAKNFDLLIDAVQTTATSLFPNFVFLDAPFNKNDLWDANNPKRYMYEIATMGCRTRVFENLHGEKSSIGRGNSSFTSINFPRLAIAAKIAAEEELPGSDKKELQALAASKFLVAVEELAKDVAEQLKNRLYYQKTALAKQFPFMLGNNVWSGGSALNPNDEVGDLLNQGTLGIGFIGGHNAMVAIYGEGHGSNDTAYQTLTEAVLRLNKVAEKYKDKYNLNYSVLATPAEGLSGRFTRLDRKIYGVIPGVTDNDYYVNSFHIDVKEHISSFDKIKKEAPFHAMTLGGHISYIELDGEAKKNTKAILKLVKAMYDEGIGYGSINHPVDTCLDCGYRGVIYGKCPVCASEHISRMRRITGYLTGSLETWNSAKRAEEKDRVKHGINN